MNQLNEIINHKEITKSCRNVNPNELLALLQSNINVFWSWGAHAFRVDNMNNPKMFRMMVQGHHHKGHVYIFVNGLDLFDVYLTTSKGRIVAKTEDQGLYFDNLVEWIDCKVERVPEYTD